MRVVTTDDTGYFRALSIPVGKQEIKAEKTNFKTAIRSGIDLNVGQEVVVNFRLEVGDLLQEVRIVAEVPIVNTTTAQISGVVGEREVKDLPAQWPELRHADRAQRGCHQLQRHEER